MCELGLIKQVIEQPNALAILESLLRYYVQGTRWMNEGFAARMLLGSPLYCLSR